MWCLLSKTALLHRGLEKDIKDTIIENIWKHYLKSYTKQKHSVSRLHDSLVSFLLTCSLHAILTSVNVSYAWIKTVFDSAKVVVLHFLSVEILLV